MCFSVDYCPRGAVASLEACWNDAEAMGVRILGPLEVSDGTDWRQVGAAKQRAVGEQQQVRELAEDNFNRARSAFGADDPATLGSAYNLANELVALGEYEQARERYEDTLAGQRRVLGEDHPRTLDTAAGLAVSLIRLGDYERARDLGEDTLSRDRRVLGDDHRWTLESATNLAVALRRLGEEQQADQWVAWIKAQQHRSDR
jgi:tetratricopeptide (TPR) repeat protein